MAEDFSLSMRTVILVESMEVTTAVNDGTANDFAQLVGLYCFVESVSLPASWEQADAVYFLEEETGEVQVRMCLCLPTMHIPDPACEQAGVL